LGRTDDLEEAIYMATKHAISFLLDTPIVPVPFINLGKALAYRYEQSGNMKDLKAMTTCNREALVLCSLGHPDRFTSLTTLDEYK
jgi:hypothetical protein